MATPIDAEAWRRGTTFYLPDGKAGLYPPVLSEGAASLLPGGPRPAVIFTVRVAPDGAVRLDGAERAIIRSRAKLAYDTVSEADLPDGFAELARRIHAAELARGAARVDPPEQEVAALGDDGFALVFRPRLASEDQNAALSLAANLAIADDAPGAPHRPVPGDGRARRARDRRAAPHRARVRPRLARYDAADRLRARRSTRRTRSRRRLMMAIRRAGEGASYTPFRDGATPWHAAMAATYAHATAPLRRLADRYVVRATLAIANGLPRARGGDRGVREIARGDGARRRARRADRARGDRSRRSRHAARARGRDISGGGHRRRRKRRPRPAARSPDRGADERPNAGPGDALALKLVSADPARRAILFAPID